MALVEAFPFAYEIEEFAYNLRDHLLGLNLGRWDYMASLIHFNLDDPAGCCPTATRSRTTSRSSRTCANASPKSRTGTGCSRSAA